jgi:hypothetical protein
MDTRISRKHLGIAILALPCLFFSLAAPVRAQYANQSYTFNATGQGYHHVIATKSLNTSTTAWQWTFQTNGTSGIYTTITMTNSAVAAFALTVFQSSDSSNTTYQLGPNPIGATCKWSQIGAANAAQPPVYSSTQNPITMNGHISVIISCAQVGAANYQFSFSGATYTGTGILDVTEFTFPLTGTQDQQLSQAFLYSHVTTNTNTVVKAAPGFLHLIDVNNPGTGESFTVYDGTSCSGLVIASSSALSNPGGFIYDVNFLDGLCITTSGSAAGDFTVSYQ